ncbi:MAG: hypothetical protein QXI12_10760 [Candidatus Methanomethyliaceae archaeon]
MPSYRQTKNNDVVVSIEYFPGEVLSLLRRLKGLRDSNGRRTTPAVWWRKGTYFRHETGRALAVILAFQLADIDQGLADQVGELLENRHKMTLDWCSGWSGGKLYLVVKTLAARWSTCRLVSYYKLNREDLRAIRDMLPRKENERERERPRQNDRSRH